MQGPSPLSYFTAENLSCKCSAQSTQSQALGCASLGWQDKQVAIMTVFSAYAERPWERWLPHSCQQVRRSCLRSFLMAQRGLGPGQLRASSRGNRGPVFASSVGSFSLSLSPMPPPEPGWKAPGRQERSGGGTSWERNSLEQPGMALECQASRSAGSQINGSSAEPRTAQHSPGSGNASGRPPPSHPSTWSSQKPAQEPSPSLW